MALEAASAPKKVVAFVGSARKKHTYEATRQFLDRIEALGGVETELLRLSDYHLELCRGCKTCFDRGEEYCPLKDDRDVLFEKMAASDGLVLASPAYTFHVSGHMKAFLDRLGFACHRPRYFGKTATSIAQQGIHGGRAIVKYLDFCCFAIGYDTVKGSHSTAFEPMTDKERRKRDTKLARHAARFHHALMTQSLHEPTVMGMLAFRMARSSMRAELDDRSRDYRYFAEHGWFESDYWYPTHVGIASRLVGAAGDRLGVWMSARRGA